MRNRDWITGIMIREEQIKEGEREHYLLCPDCEKWFDMRDLAAVFRHQHFISEAVDVAFTHTTKKGKPSEVYSSIKGRMVKLRLRERKSLSLPA
ncbi:MAG: hypothetical protein EOO10_26025 [Chitinophagaceae bacterium]|nr:MAG: hypothetical protein EOO10_26025 [Chitinophagaceae bacterium]